MGSYIVAFGLLLSMTSAIRISVNPITGNDTTCGYTPCKTLKALYQKIQGRSNVHIYIEMDIHLNNFEIQFKSVTNISIRGELSAYSHDKTIQRITCRKDAGFFINNVTNFTVANLRFQECKISREKYKAAVIIKSSAEINMTNVTMRRSITGLVFLGCVGSVLLDSVYFYSNGEHRDCHFHPIGMSVEVSVPNKTVHYMIRNTRFYDNRPSHCKKYLRPTKPGIGGGGLGIFFYSNSFNNSVEFCSCNFYNNRANSVGGGMYVSFFDSTHNNSVSVRSSTFKHNSVERGGGGAQVLFYNYHTLQERTNRVAFHDVDFYNNSARYGGGVSLSSRFGQYRYNTKKPNIVFYNCTWKRNVAVFGPAVDITPFYEKVSERNGFLPMPMFCNVSVIDNKIENKSNKLKITLHTNAGVFTITQFSVSFASHVIFSRNRYSALYLTSAHVSFERQTSVYFHYNYGSNGAAVAMFGFSYLSVYRDTHFEFINNTATRNGSALFYHTTNQLDFLSTSSCFLQYADYSNITIAERNISFLFSGNTAVSGGDDIYADTFQTCGNSCEEYPRTRDFLKCIGNVTITDDDTKSWSKFASSGQFFQFQDKTTNYDMIPGKFYNIPFNVTDEFHQNVHPILSLRSYHTKTIEVYPQYTLSGEFKPYGVPGDTAEIVFLADSLRGILFKLNISTKNCPPGFYYENKSCSCSTETNVYVAIEGCNTASFQAYMKNNYWAGYIPLQSDSYADLYFAPCFAPLCADSFKLIYLPNSTDNTDLDSVVCASNRIGVMCGKCAANTSVFYHSSEFRCVSNHLCHWGPVLYLLSEVLPMATLFAVVIIFDVSFSSGNMVGFVFFAQYLHGLKPHISETFRHMQEGYEIFYGTFNFEYFTTEHLSFCLWENFEILDVITFRYVTFLIAFGLVVTLVALLRSNRCAKMWRWREKLSYKTSFVHGLSAFLIICYNQCTSISFLVLKYVTPIGFQGKTLHTYSYHGGLPFLQSHHLIYAIPALISLVVVTILPPLFLLLYPLSLSLLSLCGISEHWIVNKILNILYINKLKPFFDCFQSCYKDRYRFFAGLYFVYRVAILCCFTLSQTNFVYRVSSVALLLIFLGIHSLTQPYKEQTHNMIDSLIFFNLALISILDMVSDFIIENLKPDKNSSGLIFVTSFQIVLLYLPMLVFLCWRSVRLVRIIRSKRRREYSGYDVIDGNGDEETEGVRECTLYAESVSEQRMSESDMVNYSSY